MTCLLLICVAKVGLAKCGCTLMRTLEPEWLKLETDPRRRCEKGDPFGLLMGTLVQLIDSVLLWHHVHARGSRQRTAARTTSRGSPIHFTHAACSAPRRLGRAGRWPTAM